MVPPGSVKIVKTMAAVLLQRHVVTSSEISGVRRRGQNMQLQALGEAAFTWVDAGQETFGLLRRKTGHRGF